MGLLFTGRLVHVQAAQAQLYADRADAQRTTTETVPAPRGSITDRNGVALAASIPAYDISADQTLIVDTAATARTLGQLLDLDTEWLRDRLDGDRRYVALAQRVPPDVWSRIRQADLPGIFGDPTRDRHYPAGAVGANVVGFVGSDGHGLAGVELSYDETLSGVDGSLTYERGADGRRIPTAEATEVAVEPGASIRLTLDRDLQWMAQEAIARQVRATNSASGTVVAMDPQTGEILALATAPTVDPGDPSAAAADDRGNRAVSEVYEPGSTSKVMTMAAVIEEGAMTPDSVLTVNDSLRRGGKTFNDHTPHPTQRLTLTGVLAKSSNVGTVLAAESIGGPKLYEYLQRFGIGRPTGMVFPGESAGQLPQPSSWSATTFPTLAFGQGFNLNSVQLASVYATLANGGVRIQPSLVSGSVDLSGEFTPAAPAISERVVSEQTADTVLAMMEAVVGEGGTAPGAAIAGYRVAGKTGTAQRVDPECGCYRGYTASFAGVAPADDPRFVVSVVLQDPKRGRYGGQLAGPVFTEVMSFGLKSKQVPPSGSATPKPRLFEGD
jgi:cell division protein FtsI (penicillin-binding protein 3)